jgi:hypothetical protein
VAWTWDRSAWGVDTIWGGLLDPKLEAYGRARQAVLDAQDAIPAELDAAHKALRLAEAAVADKFEAAWQANIDAIQTAKAVLTDAICEQARIEIECGNAARARNPVRPVLNVEEVNRVTAARVAADEAREAIGEAQQMFKAGVTVEQLEAVT